MGSTLIFFVPGHAFVALVDRSSVEEPASSSLERIQNEDPHSVLSWTIFCRVIDRMSRGGVQPSPGTGYEMYVGGNELAGPDPLSA